MLRLNKNRESFHYNLGVVGSTGNGYINSVAAHDGAGASNGNGNYIGYSNNGSSSFPLTYSTNVDPGWHFVVWSFTVQSNSGTTMSGLSSTPVYNQTGLTADQLYTNLQLARDGNWGTRAVWAISKHGNISLNSNLRTELLFQRSKWFSKISTGNYTNLAYCAIGTSEHFILAEDIKLGNTSGNSECEYHFGAMQWDAIGYSGFGPDYLRGRYTRENELTSSSSVSLQIEAGTSTVLESKQQFVLYQGETVRVNGLIKVEDDSLRTGGYARVRIQEQGTLNIQDHVCYSNEFEEFELYLTKQSTASSGQLLMNVQYVGGSTQDGNGVKYQAFSVHRVGKGTPPSTALTNQQVNQVVSGHTLTGADFVESVGPFKLGHPTDFTNFWNDTDRNLYSVHYQNQHNPANINEAVRFFSNNFTGSNQFDAQKVMFMCDNGPSSQLQHSYGIPTQNTYKDIDHKKMYYAGFWVRVHSMGNSVSQAPTRIQVLGNCKNSSNTDVQMDDYQGNTMPSNRRFAFMSVYSSSAAGNGNDSEGWQLYGGFYLPSFFSDAEVLKFHDEAWQKWAGIYNVGTNEAASGYPGAINEIVTTQLGRVARMPTTAAKIQTELSFEIQTGVSINSRVAFPFMVEIDPMNLAQDGRVFFWDFYQQNTPAL